MVALGLLACKDEPINPFSTTGALPGKFSVAEGKQVHFSQGNLQYKAISHTWRFAVRQYDVIGEANEKISPTYDGWIDLFGWGTGNAPTKHSILSSYIKFHEWGANAINNGGNKANQWRTLTYMEWDYLVNSRANAADLQGQAWINGVYGYVLLPDNWITPDGLNFNNGDKYNQYTASQWAKMEKAGAVFLPAAGRRGTKNDPEPLGSPEVIRSSIDYWSATPFYSEDAYCLVCRWCDWWSSDGSEGRDMETFFSCTSRATGMSVRLVKDVE